MKNQIGVIGLGTMGKALAQNLYNNGFLVSGFNRSYEVAKKMQEENKGFLGCENLSDFINSLEKPRKIIFMLPAGKIIDEYIEKCLEFLDDGDIIMDAGNSYFKDTKKREKYLALKNINYFGVGVSGGEKGALLGPSIMPGGKKESYDLIKPFLNKISAKKNGEDCCVYIGENGAGHYVKMVHNGIEYADMQIIAEIYLLLKNAYDLSNVEISDFFKELNDGESKSYLLEITYKILKIKDDKTKNDIIDMIKDTASQKGTGKWTSLEAIHQNQDISLIHSALTARFVSNMENERDKFNNKINKTNTKLTALDKKEIKSAYYLAKLVAYAQGFSQMADASKLYNWDLDLSKIASIFRAGCIIQAQLLELLMRIYAKNNNLENFLLDTEILDTVNGNINNLRNTVVNAIKTNTPTPTLNSALIYLDQLNANLLGANLISAQRDFFGAHTFKRIDEEGDFHYEWE